MAVVVGVERFHGRGERTVEAGESRSRELEEQGVEVVVQYTEGVKGCQAEEDHGWGLLGTVHQDHQSHGN